MEKHRRVRPPERMLNGFRAKRDRLRPVARLTCTANSPPGAATAGTLPLVPVRQRPVALPLRRCSRVPLATSTDIHAKIVPVKALGDSSKIKNAHFPLLTSFPFAVAAGSREGRRLPRRANGAKNHLGAVIDAGHMSRQSAPGKA
jgi:hypothetical protein